jgi:outer membrane protein OmpA-like peptidoglycan-associated protein
LALVLYEKNVLLGSPFLNDLRTVDLDRVVSLIADSKEAGDKVMLFGFSDNSGAVSINQAVSLSRAREVKNQLAQRGLDPVVVRGFGSTVAVASNDSPDGQAKNRRVEIWMKQ